MAQAVDDVDTSIEVNNVMTMIQLDQQQHRVYLTDPYLDFTHPKIATIGRAPAFINSSQITVMSPLRNRHTCRHNLRTDHLHGGMVHSKLGAEIVLAPKNFIIPKKTPHTPLNQRDSWTMLRINGLRLMKERDLETTNIKQALIDPRGAVDFIIIDSCLVDSPTLFGDGTIRYLYITRTYLHNTFIVIGRSQHIQHLHFDRVKFEVDQLKSSGDTNYMLHVDGHLQVTLDTITVSPHRWGNLRNCHKIEIISHKIAMTNHNSELALLLDTASSPSPLIVQGTRNFLFKNCTADASGFVVQSGWNLRMVVFIGCEVDLGRMDEGQHLMMTSVFLNCTFIGKAGWLSKAPRQLQPWLRRIQKKTKGSITNGGWIWTKSHVKDEDNASEFNFEW